MINEKSDWAALLFSVEEMASLGGELLLAHGLCLLAGTQRFEIVKDMAHDDLLHGLGKKISQSPGNQVDASVDVHLHIQADAAGGLA